MELSSEFFEAYYLLKYFISGFQSQALIPICQSLSHHFW